MRLGIGVLVLAVLVSAGDREVAEFLFSKGQKALRAKQFEEAEANFRRAIEEDSPYPEASYGLGQALEKLDRGGDACQAYRECIAAIDSLDEPSGKQKSIASRAARALKKIRREFAALDKLNKGYVRDFIALGKKHMKANPRWSRRAFEAVLALDPGNKIATSYLAKLPGGESPAKASGKSWGKPVIRKDSLGNWQPGASNEWSIRGTVITGDSTAQNGHINWLENAPLTGDYSVQVRFRLVRDGGERRTIGVFVSPGNNNWWSMMFEGAGDLVLIRTEGERNSSTAVRSLGRVDWEKWHTFRLHVKGEVARMEFDGKEVLEYEFNRNQQFRGQLGLFFQCAKVEYKDIEVLK